MHIVIRAAIDGTGFERIPPHLFIRDAVGADETDSVELKSELPNLTNVGQAQVDNHNVGTMTVNDVSYLVDVTRDAYALEIGMQFCCEVFGHDAVRLGHDHIVWFHDSLSFTTPSGGG